MTIKNLPKYPSTMGIPIKRIVFYIKANSDLRRAHPNLTNYSFDFDSAEIVEERGTKMLNINYYK